MKRVLLMILTLGALAACATPAEKAAAGLARRLVPQYKIDFREVPDSVERYSFRTEGARLVIEGSSASAMAVGLNRYLNDWCHCTVSWYAADAVEVPEVQPRVPSAVSGKALVPERFFLNYCTFGYTMPWFQWADWERLIDWMALQGVNLPLAITGEEAVWQEVWREFGLTDEQIRAYFTGPAHLPWHRMCNIDGVEGPLPQEWIDGQAALQEQILARERELGMRPVLPAFGGHVPGQLKALFPSAQITDVARWCGFPEENRCHFLSPSDSLYGRIQRAFLEAQTRRFGTDHIYGFDLFNEVPPPSWEPSVLADIGRGAYESVAAVDPEAQWLQMGWLFYNDSRHWTPENVKAYLEAVPPGKVTILDYYTENVPVWQQTEAFFGQPYIFCYLGNFGGNTRLAGPFRKESARITEALAEGGAQGIGCTLEGFGVNQWMYEYVLGRAWETGVSDDAWLSSLDRRRGSPEGFWQDMADSVYLRGSFSEGPLLCGRPCDEGYHLWTVIYQTPYDPAVLERMLARLKAHPSASAAWQTDVVTLECQVLGNRFAPLRDAFVAACRAGDLPAAKELGGQMKALLLELDALAGHRPEFRAEDWLEAAAAWGPFRDNAWHLLTIWGGDTPYLNDYASRLWSGLVRAYYLPRWELFIDTHLSCLERGVAFDEAAFHAACRALELRLAAHAPSFRELNLLTWNVGVFSKYGGSSLPDVAACIRGSGAQLVALNELDSCNRRHPVFQLQELADSLGWQGHFARAFPFAGGAYGNGVVSRDPILHSWQLALPQADGGEPRSVAVVETVDCVFAAVHLDHLSEQARLVQVATLNEWFSARFSGFGKPVLLCGDLNARPESATLKALGTVWNVLSGDAFTYSTKDPHGCIDYVLALRSAAPVRVRSRQVLTEGTSGLSDHFPVQVRLCF